MIAPKAELGEFAADPSIAPPRILPREPQNQLANLRRQTGPSSAPRDERGRWHAAAASRARSTIRSSGRTIWRRRISSSWRSTNSSTSFTCKPRRLRRSAPSSARCRRYSQPYASGSGDNNIGALQGPGKAFGYESLIDGRPSPLTAITRERALLLVLPWEPFEQLFNGEDAVSRVFLDVIQRDLVATLRQGLRQNARLVSSV